MSLTPRFALLAGLAVLLAACDEQPAQKPTLLSTERAITNGTPDTSLAHGAVVALGDSRRDFFCSGTLIAPRVVMTAAHCAVGKLPSGILVGFGNDVSSPDMHWEVVNEIKVHPEWSSERLANDLALLRLARAAPAGVEPIPALPAALALGQADVGTTVEFSGFGRTETGGSGIKLKVSDALSCVCEAAAGCSCLGETVSPWTICYDQQPGGPCSGDSGGPAFVTLGGQEYVAGVTSYGDWGCTQFGCSTKADHFDAFVQAFIGVVGNQADGVACQAGSDCQSGFCVDGVCCNGPCGGDTCDACTVALGAQSDGWCTALSPSVTCDDGNLCTLNDACSSGRCVGALVTCAAPDPCHKNSACDPATGQCLPFEPKSDGVRCSDSDECTVEDSCLQGVCVGTARTTCAATNPCKEDAVCADGVCGEYPDKPDGTACEDGNPCTLGDSCTSGSCRGGPPLACPAPSPCHYASACNPGTGQCLPNSEKAEGAACSDGSACTTGDRCSAGECVGEITETSCPAPDDCHVGVCDAQSGDCNLEPVADGTACEDGNPCTRGERCAAGACAGGEAACTPPDACQIAVDCDEEAGCTFGPAPEGTGCDDEDPCTRDDVCTAGACAGVAVSCPAAGECQAAGTCESAAGGCVNPPVADGTACTGGTCRAGTCVKAESEDEAGGCGCGAGGAAAPASLLFALLGLAAPRRRTRR